MLQENLKIFNMFKLPIMAINLKMANSPLGLGDEAKKLFFVSRPNISITIFMHVS